MGRTIVNNQKTRFCGGIGWLAHNLVNKAIKGSDAVFAFSLTEQFGTMHINGRNTGPSAVPDVFMLHFHRDTWLGRISG